MTESIIIYHTTDDHIGGFVKFVISAAKDDDVGRPQNGGTSARVEDRKILLGSEKQSMGSLGIGHD